MNVIIKIMKYVYLISIFVGWDHRIVEILAELVYTYLMIFIIRESKYVRALKATKLKIFIMYIYAYIYDDSGIVIWKKGMF